MTPAVERSLKTVCIKAAGCPSEKLTCELFPDVEIGNGDATLSNKHRAMREVVIHNLCVLVERVLVRAEAREVEEVIALGRLDHRGAVERATGR